MKKIITLTTTLLLVVGLTGCGKDVSGVYEYNSEFGINITLHKDKTISYYEPENGEMPNWSKYTVSGNKVVFSINPDSLVFTVDGNGDLIGKDEHIYKKIR